MGEAGVREQVDVLGDFTCAANFSKNQFCGSGIQYLFYPWIRDGLKTKIRIPDEHFGSYFRELRNNFLR
jgi:hypothetical protein